MENVAKYWKCEDGLDTYFDDDGFYVYNVNGDEFYVAHCYVEDRSKSYKFFNKMKEAARGFGCKYLSGNLDRNEENKESYKKKVMVHLGNGYDIVDVTTNRITVTCQL